MFEAFLLSNKKKMTIEELKFSISKGEKTLENIESAPTEDWLLTGISQTDNDSINHMLKSPIKKSKYKHWSDRLTCPVCGGVYNRSNQSEHRRTKVHRAYQDMNDKVRDLLLKK